MNSSSYLIKRSPSADPSVSAGAHWEPNTDVYRSEDKLVIKVELAGMRREDLELCVEGNKLTITGQRPDCSRPPGSTFMVMEINYGPFSCEFQLPDEYALASAMAAYQNGFLMVEVPQSVRSRPERTLLEIAGEK